MFLGAHTVKISYDINNPVNVNCDLFNLLELLIQFMFTSLQLNNDEFLRKGKRTFRNSSQNQA